MHIFIVLVANQMSFHVLVSVHKHQWYLLLFFMFCCQILASSSLVCLLYLEDLLRLRQRLHGIGSICNRTQMGTFRPCVHTGPTGTVPNGTASRTQMGSLTKAIPFGTVPRKVSCKRVERFQTGTARK